MFQDQQNKFKSQLVPSGKRYLLNALNGDEQLGETVEGEGEEEREGQADSVQQR